MRYLATFFSSMVGRIFLVMLLGTWLALALSFWVASLQGERNIAHVRGRVIADRAAHWLALADALPPEQRNMASRLAEREGVRLSLGRLPPAAPEQRVSHIPPLLRDRLDPNITLLEVIQSPEECPQDDDADDRCAPRRLQALARLSDGTPVTVDMPDLGPRRHPPFLERFAVQMSIFALALLVLAGGVAFWVARPLRTMTRAALSLGHNIAQPPLPERGPTEVRDAARAFNRMQSRIRQYVNERTGLLAAVTHDLQTPLTRMRLRLETMPDEPMRDKLLQDLEHMTQMVKEGLDLARSLDAPPPSQLLALDSLVYSVCEDAAEGGNDVQCQGESGATVRANPVELRRCLANLITNAVNYGRYARVRIAREAKDVAIHVEDGGPGIPADQLEKVLEPFVRLEGSRSRDTGGTGLGLTIAHNIARNHGGSLTLSNRAEGGLAATLRIPLGTGGA